MDSTTQTTPEETFQAIMKDLDAEIEGKAFLERQVSPSKDKKKRAAKVKGDTKPSMSVEKKEVLIEFK